MDHDIKKAVRCAILAKEVYHDFADELFKFSEFVDAKFGLVQDLATDTQSGWVYEPDDEHMYLIFRGTEKNTDWKTNVTFSRNLFQILDTDKVEAAQPEAAEPEEDAQMGFDAPSSDFDSFDAPIEEDVIEDEFGEAPAIASGAAAEAEGMQIVPVPEEELAPSLANSMGGRPRDLAPDSPRALMHLGFVTAYMSIQDRIHEAVEQFKPKRLTITGHSLGGALATLAAIDFALTEVGRFDIELYTFGAPRVGNKQFQELYNKHIPKAFRFVNGLDIVPSVPRTWQGYHHIGNEIRIGPRWSWRFFSARVSDHFMVSYIPALEKLLK